MINNKSEEQFELHVEGQVARITYEIEGKKIYLFSARVPVDLRGKGIGSKLVEESVDLIESMGLKIIPYCTFIQSWFLSHQDKTHLLA